jgi:hypothetical protein
LLAFVRIIDMSGAQIARPPGVGPDQAARGKARAAEGDAGSLTI